MRLVVFLRVERKATLLNVLLTIFIDLLPAYRVQEGGKSGEALQFPFCRTSAKRGMNGKGSASQRKPAEPKDQFSYSGKGI